MLKNYLNFRKNHPKLANLIDWIIYPALIFILVAAVNYCLPIPKGANKTDIKYLVRLVPFVLNIVGILFFYAPASSGFVDFVMEKQDRKKFLHSFFSNMLFMNFFVMGLHAVVGVASPHMISNHHIPPLWTLGINGALFPLVTYLFFIMLAGLGFCLTRPKRENFIRKRTISKEHSLSRTRRYKKH